MIIKADHTGTIENFQNIVEETLANDAVKGLLILACEANGFKPENVNEILTNVSIPLLGGVFPQLILAQTKLTRGTLVIGLLETPDVLVIPGLSNPAVDYDDVIDEQYPELGEAQTMMVFVDGLSTRISALIDSLFNVFGLEINYIGGGAGSLTLVQQPCLFTNQGLVQDSAVLALLKTASGIGVSHGWHSIRGPFKVTESEKNVIKTLDWRPAFDVYREILAEEADITITPENFFDLAKGYPFGINRLGSEKVIRDPIAVIDGSSLVCVGEVPSESYVDIMTGDTQSLVQAAARAVKQGKAHFKAGDPASTTLFIDCISRVLFLEDEFAQELNAVYDQATSLVGALTLGEIANSGENYLEFYNKTAVIAVME
ncbi:MAG: FIST C-terminal domain-containing protein [Ardenticatenaceae bacterium]|nr:FIST C-terminal domain-containing protein [Ardenticatenaceae bacterium]MCB9445248.1 FIST C-terminal domain-containing protein [Ardenticatenaceae bacterium]